MSFFKLFSHIYIEEDVANHKNTKSILSRFKDAEKIYIKHYKDIFNRKNQSYSLQKESKKLILAKKREPFIYEGSDLIQDFGFSKYLYTPTMMNCIYDCDYCILQGMYGSANILFFVNVEEYFSSLKSLENSKAHLSISYDTDLLAFEKIFGICRLWIKEISKYPNIDLEIRSKSANFEAIADMKPLENVVLSWTIMPQVISSKVERNTPSVIKREEQIIRALKLGWRVRICIDPLIYVEGFEKIYGDYIDSFFEKIGEQKIEDVALGVFRINSDFLKKMKKRDIRNELLFYPYDVRDKVATYEDSLKKRMLDFTIEKLTKYIPKNRIFLSKN